MDVPLFPLHTVLFPGVVLPLHIFEARYRLMVQRLLEGGGTFGVVLIREGQEAGSENLTVAEIGTLAEIREANRLDDGRFDLMAAGTQRFRLRDVVIGREPYFVGEIDPLDEAVGDADRAAQLAAAATRRFVRYLELVQPADDEGARDVPLRIALRDPVDLDEPTETRPEPIDSPLAIPDEPTALSHLLAGIVELDLPRRQALLEADTTELRLAAIAGLLEREIAFLESRLRVYTPDLRQAALRRN
jgi:Lon protease-like protein